MKKILRILSFLLMPLVIILFLTACADGNSISDPQYDNTDEPTVNETQPPPPLSPPPVEDVDDFPSVPNVDLSSFIFKINGNDYYPGMTLNEFLAHGDFERVLHVWYDIDSGDEIPPVSLDEIPPIGAWGQHQVDETMRYLHDGLSHDITDWEREFNFSFIGDGDNVKLGEYILRWLDFGSFIDFKNRNQLTDDMISIELPHGLSLDMTAEEIAYILDSSIRLVEIADSSEISMGLSVIYNYEIQQYVSDAGQGTLVDGLWVVDDSDVDVITIRIVDWYILSLDDEENGLSLSISTFVDEHGSEITSFSIMLNIY